MKQGCLLHSHMIMLGGVRGLLEPFFETIMMVTDEKSLLETEARSGFKPGIAETGGPEH